MPLGHRRGSRVSTPAAPPAAGELSRTWSEGRSRANRPTRGPGESRRRFTRGRRSCSCATKHQGGRRVAIGSGGGHGLDPGGPSEPSKLLLASRAVQSLGAKAFSLARHCPRCGSGGHGRPYFAGRHDLAVSLASAEGVTAAAVTRGAPVGVDIEHLDDARFAGIGDVLLHPDEHAAGAAELARTWVRKESLLKALGVGLGTDPRAIRLSPATEPPTLLAPLPDGRGLRCLDRSTWRSCRCDRLGRGAVFAVPAGQDDRGSSGSSGSMSHACTSGSTSASTRSPRCSTNISVVTVPCACSAAHDDRRSKKDSSPRVSRSACRNRAPRL